MLPAYGGNSRIRAEIHDVSVCGRVPVCVCVYVCAEGEDNVTERYESEVETTAKAWKETKNTLQGMSKDLLEKGLRSAEPFHDPS
jgi:hypothetical protein